MAPLLPEIVFQQESHRGKQQHLTHKIHAPKPAPQTTPQPNQVIIPGMLLDQPILEGPVSQQYKTLDQGIWRWPKSSTPDKGGNTVLIGHRFTYTNPRGIFYFLNKLKTGDEIGVFWDGQKYLYKVVRVSEVPPTDTAIEDNTTQAELTLFTCTPLWLPKNRLVVVANLESHS